MAQALGSQLSVSGAIDLSSFDSRATPGFERTKEDAADALVKIGAEMSDLQEQLFAAGRSESTRDRVLLVLQGMDTSGKGGIIRHVAGLVDPQGLAVTSFKKPTAEELEHDFLWRVEKALPDVGMIGVFDRSHYEDVLIGRVRSLATPDEIERRYDAINAFEQSFADSGGVIVKCFLHITKEDQRDRLAARLDDPTKRWKFNPGDLDEREVWDDYQAAYAIAIERCSTDAAPWHLVPSGRKWYRNWAVATLLLEQLRELDLGWPPADFDVEAQRARLAAM
ncbi:PPK2 family polyphosphate kinase [Aeromicrobium stalagmiti]|uniref:PPK2 family polyphosphate kinase n=1 Tax=Aeromicrobium stalagmiti TaxID=2738988 RepID=UPI001568FC60|nr:PPK2 family polyphosphate kinase [Aeromicrobium stalagmiti]NRQ50504.1 polyphosphate kinase 2 family protein [Aeromicrobium stalagmiti]